MQRTCFVRLSHNYSLFHTLMQLNDLTAGILLNALSIGKSDSTIFLKNVMRL